MGLVRVSLIAALAALTLAGGAQAAGLTKNGNTLRWASGGAFHNSLVINYVQELCPIGESCPPKYTFRDTVEGTTVSGAPGCLPAGDVLAGTTITCTAGAANPVDALSISLGDGNDELQTDPCAGLLCLVVDPDIPVPMTVSGDGGDDTLSGSLADDTINGGDGADNLFGEGGGDNIDGGDGPDLLVGGLGSDAPLDGGPGIDLVSYDDGRAHGVRVTLKNGAAQNDGGPEDGPAGERDAVVNVENVNGSQLRDRLVGDAQANSISGLGGKDTIRGRRGDDAIDGGAGVDTVSFLGGGGVRVKLKAGTATGQGSDSLVSIQNVIGSSSRDVLRGNARRNVLDGRGGNDSIYGLAGKDFLRGGSGRDLCAGGSGRDRATACESLSSIP